MPFEGRREAAMALAELLANSDRDQKKTKAVSSHPLP